MDALAHQIPGEYPAHDDSLIRIDLRESICSFPIAEEAGVIVVNLAVSEVFSVTPLDVAAEGFAFGLCLTHHKGEDHLIVHVERIDILLLEEHAHSMFFQAADITQAIQRVTAEAGDRLCNDQVDLPILAGLDHFTELLAFLGGCTGDSFV